MTTPPVIGPILTSARSLDPLKGFPVVKVIPAWGMADGWTPARIAEVARLPATLIVRTSWGDPSAYGGGRPYPVPDRILEELRPWLDARPDAVIEIGNEPFLHAYPIIPAQYAVLLDDAVRACRDAFPRARILPPAHSLNDPRLDAAVGQWLAACAGAYRRCDGLTLHAYTHDQLRRGLALLRTHVGAGPVWITELNLNERLDPDERARRLVALARDARAEAALVYHVDELGGTDPPHFQPNYRLGPAELAALRQAAVPPAPPEEPAMRNVIAELARYRTDTLRRGTWTIGTRQGKPTAITLHWNGPAIPEARRRGNAVLDQLKVDLEWQTRPSWPGATGGADGLQYHRAIDADGVVWVCREDSARLWHCGHAEGNRDSLSLHVLVGRGQGVTAAQWASTVRQVEAWSRQYGINRVRVLGHQEWASSECPGPELMTRLRAWRGTAPTPAPAGPVGLRRFVVTLPAEARATVRQGPSRAYPVAGHLKPGSVLLVDALLADEIGERIDGATAWAHMARVPDQQPDLGFVHLSALKEAA